MKLASTIILYNPTSQVIQNIYSWIDNVDYLYVFDNTELPPAPFIQQLKSITKVKYFSNGQNQGIAARLNQAIQQANADGCDCLLTMDQDSFFEKDIFATYKNCVATSPAITSAAVFGVEYQHNNAQTAQCTAISVNHLITSGSIINIASAIAIGGFNESYFIDFVDIEYCFKAIKQGFSVVKFENIFLTHQLGETEKKRSVATLQASNRVFHSPQRIYYMLRNFFLLQQEYKTLFPADIGYFRRTVFTSAKNNFLYRSQRFLLVKLIFRAYFDFKKNKLGKYTSN